MAATDELLLKLSNLDALPGQEAQVQQALQEMIQEAATKDTFGNLYFGDLGTKKKKIALYAHMDEVGFFVQRMTEEGFVYFYPVGSWWGHVVLGQQVRATCRKNGAVLEGIVGTLPKTSHKMTEIVPISEMYIDFGVRSKAELEAAGLQIGDMILPNTQAKKSFNQKKIMGKALDNRVACTVIAQVKNHVETKNIEVIGVGTVQEEAGTRGSKVAAAQVNADINIVIDVANGKDTPKAAEYPNRIQGAGPGLVLSDKTALGNIQLLDYCKRIAEKNHIPWQYDLLGGGGTDAGSVQLFAGKPTLVFCVPVRYCHSWNSIVEISDVEATIQLLSKVIHSFDEGGIDLEQF
ncbi:M42 family metallopeptidase [Candidatus Enterococcus murrayae]|uniref:M42 family peptidase n=1 Tax=Candidatus Enterococcus murrayae TaxID=2815321 RepID=A0ABS3HIK2_9ENTE|nr:M42 family peptidase [Enterococcus sp. MJM16]MBO0453282.1 M42 family peptidase [Enterococcus sp. MJM16]